MKLAKLKFRIIVESVVLAIVLLLIGGVFLMTGAAEKKAKKEVKGIKSQINSAQEKIDKFESKLNETNRYSLIYDKLPEKFKSTREIKISEANEIISKAKDRNNISSISVKINVPQKSETATHTMNRIATYVTKGSISFGTYYDVDALNFISDLKRSFPGYLILTEVTLKKAKKEISGQDLIDISKGEEVKIIDGAVKFIWYFYYDTRPPEEIKEVDIKQSEENKDQKNNVPTQEVPEAAQPNDSEVKLNDNQNENL